MNKIKSVIIMGILVISILIVISPVSATTYHVYPGDDIRAIIQGASAGDTIYIHAGTYNITMQINIPADNITIIGDDPLTTILDASGISWGDVITTSGHNYMIIRNLTVQNNPDDDGIEVQQYCEVTNCIIKNCDDGIVYDTEGHHNTIQHCIVSDCRGDGIQVYDYNTIKNCITYNNGSDGLDVAYNSEVINCTSANNGSDGIELEDDCNIYNCIFVNNDDDGLEVDSEGIYIYNSNSWGNGDEDWEYSISDDVYLINCISVDPKFVNGIDTFYLSPGSPCVDKGSTSSAALGLYQGFTTRTDGIWDKGIVDMGFHYKSNRGPPSSLPMAKILEILKGNQEE